MGVHLQGVEGHLVVVEEVVGLHLVVEVEVEEEGLLLVAVGVVEGVGVLALSQSSQVLVGLLHFLIVWDWWGTLGTWNIPSGDVHLPRDDTNTDIGHRR